jgi:hypothetical protein
MPAQKHMTKQQWRAEKAKRLASFSKSELLRFALLAIAGLTAASLVFMLAVSGIARQRAPDQALRFISYDGTALAAKADIAMLSGEKIDARKLAANGRAALLNGPLNARAVRQVATAAKMQGQDAQAFDLLKRAESLSRRDALTHVLLVEEAANRNDAPAALHHYDLALRTSKASSQLLFPRLSLAIRHPSIRAELKPLIRSDRNWPAAFMVYARDNSANLTPLVDLLLETGGVPDPVLAKMHRATIISALFYRGQYSQVARLLLVSADGTRLMTSAGLETMDRFDDFGPAAWLLMDDVDAGAVANGTKADATMLIYATPETTKLVAHKLLYLAPGAYQFGATVKSADKGRDGAFGWQLRCLSGPNKGQIWRVWDTGATTRSDLTIPTGCPSQLLEITASGGTGDSGLEAEIGAISMRPRGV